MGGGGGADQPPPYAYETKPGQAPYPNVGFQPVPAQPIIDRPPQQQQQATVTIIQSGPLVLRDTPVRLTCIYCHADVITRVNYKDGTMTHMVALIMCIFGLWPCCLIPYCVDSCRDADHICPNCDRYLGTYKR